MELLRFSGLFSRLPSVVQLHSSLQARVISAPSTAAIAYRIGSKSHWVAGFMATQWDLSVIWSPVCIAFTSSVAFMV